MPPQNVGTDFFLPFPTRGAGFCLSCRTVPAAWRRPAPGQGPQPCIGSRLSHPSGLVGSRGLASPSHSAPQRVLSSPSRSSPQLPRLWWEATEPFHSLKSQEHLVPGLIQPRPGFIFAFTFFTHLSTRIFIWPSQRFPANSSSSKQAN